MPADRAQLAFEIGLPLVSRIAVTVLLQFLFVWREVYLRAQKAASDRCRSQKSLIFAAIASPDAAIAYHSRLPVTTSAR